MMEKKQKQYGNRSKKNNSQKTNAQKSNGAKNQSQSFRRPNRAPRKSTIDPLQLIQLATSTEAKKITVDTKFEALPLQPQLLKNIQKLGFVSPTEIQDKTLEKLLEGENLIGIANTGTGKTGAFLIPIIERLLREPNVKFQSLVVVPTRELALQVQDDWKDLSRDLKLQSTCYIGGTNIETDVRDAKQYHDLIVGTPGRLLDLSNRGALRLRNIEVLVLDEFDKMLDMGFIHDIRKLVGELKQRKQTLLFSATRDPKQQKIIAEIVKNPLLVEIDSGEKSSDHVNQDVIRVGENEDKFSMLTNLLAEPEYTKVILFIETKHLADRIAKRLNKAGISADAIHGNKSQNYRVKALDKFKKGTIRVLVATDVAARGIDVEDVSLVMNYQLPGDYDTYIHRVGRTGRAGKTGTAFTFVDESYFKKRGSK